MSGRMAAEMAEQPGVLGAMLERRSEIAGSIASLLPRRLSGATLVARGSSDHAARYGRYLLEMTLRRPVSLAAPSIHTIYGADVDYRGYLAIAISQSGRTPEVVTVLREMRAAGATTVALVNDPGSPLAAAAHLVVPLGAAEERAVPATKTFTATLLALAIVAEGTGSVPWEPGDLERVPVEAARLLEDRGVAGHGATRIAAADRVMVTARGLLLCAAEETALKVRETTARFAQALSVADLRHGPIAAITPEVPVVAISAPGASTDGVLAFEAELRERGVDVVRIGGDGAELSLPASLPEALQVVPAAIRGQQLAVETALALGRDPDHPNGLSKVTLTA